MFTVLISILLSVISAEAASIQEAAKSDAWLKLLHYRKSSWGGVKSESEAPFFLAKDGRTNPEAELKADIDGFFSNPQTQCQFPARLMFLDRQGFIDRSKLPKVVCDKYENFRTKLAAKSVTLVFSAYYLNNPASAFGHTFLRINKTPHSLEGKRYELLDYGINYAANVTISNALLYAIYGAAGWFQGSYTSVPYYYKVREYNDYESRDLWEYQLNLTQDQVDLLVAHFWELGSTYFYYYYFTQNCSYHMLAALDAAAPALNLVEHNPYIVIPADTVKVVAETPGLVKQVDFRPAGRTVFKNRYEKLSSKERDALLKIFSTHDSSTLKSSGFTDREQANILDTAMDYVDYRYSKEILMSADKGIDTENTRWKQDLLMQRSQVPVTTEDLIIKKPVNEMPHLGIASKRLTVGMGQSHQYGRNYSLGIRFALHDLLDSTIGFPSYAAIEFGSARVRYNVDQKSWWLEDFSLFHVNSLTPFRAYHPQYSWKARVGADTMRDRTCNDCTAGVIQVGGGLTFDFADWMSAIPMIEGEIAGAPGFQGSWLRLGAGPSLRLRSIMNERFIAQAWASQKYFALTDHHTGNEFGVEARKTFGSSVAIGVKSVRYPKTYEHSLMFYTYF